LTPMTTSRDTNRTKLPAAAAIAAAVVVLATAFLLPGDRDDATRTVEIDSVPQGASVFIDDVFVGVTGDRNPVLAKVSVDRHALMFQKAGHTTLFASFDPRDGGPPYVFCLRPVPTGALRVDTTPPGADVILDGQLVGATPLEMFDLPAGRYALRLEKTNHRPWYGTIKVEEHKRATVEHVLADRLREYLENCVAACPDEPAPRLELAHYYVVIGELDLAPSCYARSVALSERTALGATRRDMPQNEREAITARCRLAARQLKKDMTGVPRDERGLEFLARMQAVLSDHEAWFPSAVQARRKEAAVLERARAWDRALSTISETLVGHPDNAGLLEDMARLCIAAGDEERAPAAVREALRRSNDEPLVAMDLADAALGHADGLGEHAAREIGLAIEQELRVVDTSHSTRRAHRVASLSYGLLRSAGRLREAMGHLDRALDTADGNAERDSLADGAHSWLAELGNGSADPETVSDARALMRRIDSLRERTRSE
jgi:tetratricopeptide (TPR) repeat protein